MFLRTLFASYVLAIAAVGGVGPTADHPGVTTLRDLQDVTLACPAEQPRDPAACGRPTCVVDILGPVDLRGQDSRAVLKAAVRRNDTLVRLGPNVDLNFSGLPSDWLPILFGRCITLTSFNPAKQPPPILKDAVGSTSSPPPAADSTAAAARVSAPALGLTPDTAQARTPSTPGPVLRYGNHRAGDPTFLEIQCNPKETPNDGARISGFRLFGPDFGQQKTFEIGIRVRRCIDIEIANMEIAGWGASAIRIDDVEGADQSTTGDGPYGRIMNPDQIRIHHNFIHHNQHPSARPDTVRNTIINVVTLWIGGKAEGYGVNVHNGAWAKISANVFDFNRHAIAASGKVGGYDAERNLTLKGGGYHGKWYGRYTHIFDVHGTGCWWSSNLCGEAGDRIWDETNAFQDPNGPAIKLRGRPRRSYPVGGAYIADNIFPHDGLENDWGDDAVHLQTSENVKFGPNNVIKVETIGQYGVCDFDGDAIDDLFLATGKTWWFSSFGEYQWATSMRRTSGCHRCGLVTSTTMTAAMCWPRAAANG